MQQLELYKEMDCPRNIEKQSRYQRWLYQRELQLALDAGCAPERVRFEDEEVREIGKGEGEGNEDKVRLRCRMCRYIYTFFMSQTSNEMATCHVNILIYIPSSHKS
jgi:dual specificity phosphatase 12